MSKDTIYREDAVKILTENVTFEFIEDKEWAITCLQNLSSADRPQGEWIDDVEAESMGYYWANCSQCGLQIDVHENRGYYNFCPNCGARMKGADDD